MSTQTPYSDEKALAGQFITFALDNALYGIEITYVKQIIVMPELTKAQGASQYVQGVVSLQNHTIAALDIRAKFTNQIKPYGPKSCMIILMVDDTLLGVIVDEVYEVIAISENDITDTPTFDPETKNRFVRGIGKWKNDVFAVLDCHALKQVI